MVKFLEKLHNGIIEIGFHPGLDDKALRKKLWYWDNYYDYSFSWQGDFDTLMDPDVSNFIDKKNIQLINYSQL